MITRIEIDGFKSFLDFELDVPPLLVLAGPNASGKSNLFDALSLFADVVEFGGAKALRSQRRGNAADLFHRYADGSTADTARITVEVLTEIPPLGLIPARLQVTIEGGEDGPRADTWRLTTPRRSRFSGRLAAAAEIEEGRVLGPGRPEVLSFEPAIAKETASWRALTLQPEVMRLPAPAPDESPLDRSGRNLAAVLHRLAHDDRLWRVEADLATLIPGVVEIKPLLDERRQEYDFDAVFARSGPLLPRLLSDGTLRCLGLLAAAQDPASGGVLAIEELENGIHPGRVFELLDRLARDLPDLEAPELSGTLKQVMVTTHSPALISALWPERQDSLMFTEAVTKVADGRSSLVTRVLPVKEDGEPGTFTSPWDVERFLSSVRGAEP